MGIRHNFKQAYELVNRALGKDWDEKKVKVVRIVGLELFRRAILRSPVDTGFYRNSHALTIGLPSASAAGGASPERQTRPRSSPRCPQTSG